MDAIINDIKNHQIVKDLQDTKKFLLMNKREMYDALKANQEYFNREPRFKGDKPHELDMVDKMNGLGFNIR